jgi:hypothetical protein
LEQNTEIHNYNSCWKLSLHVECCGNNVFYDKNVVNREIELCNQFPVHIRQMKKCIISRANWDPSCYNILWTLWMNILINRLWCPAVFVCEDGLFCFITVKLKIWLYLNLRSCMILTQYVNSLTKFWLRMYSMVR